MGDTIGLTDGAEGTAGTGSVQLTRDWLAGFEPGPATVFGNLAVFPLRAALRSDTKTEQAGEPAYLTLGEALADGSFSITEQSESGSVEQLVALNDGAKPVLLVDGEELIGAKQNRIINLTVLVPARTKMKIPVSCVEAGRWDYNSAVFSEADHFYNARNRARKSSRVSGSMERGQGRQANQSAVWEEVGELRDRVAGSHSPSGALDHAYRDHSKTLNQYVGAFRVAADQVGAVFAINGEVVGLEAFDSTRPYQVVADKLIRSYALDAIAADRERAAREKAAGEKAATGGEDKAAESEAMPTVSPTAAAEFIAGLSDVEANSYPALGLGEDVRFGTGDDPGADTGGDSAGGPGARRGSGDGISEGTPNWSGGQGSARQRSSRGSRSRRGQRQAQAGSGISGGALVAEGAPLHVCAFAAEASAG